MHDNSGEEDECKIDADCKGVIDDPLCGATCIDGECVICALLQIVASLFCAGQPCSIVSNLQSNYAYSNYAGAVVPFE